MRALQLPALTVEAKAELITNNLPAFEEAFRAGLETFKYELLEDSDFDKAKEDLKIVKDTEDKIKEVDQAIVNGSADIKEIRESLAKLGEEARSFRLDREKVIKKRDAEIRLKTIDEALALIDHPKRESFRSDIEGGTKNKRSTETRAKGANSVAKGINDLILASRTLLDEFENSHGKTLIPDRVNLELESAELVGGKLEARLEKQRDEEEKARLKEEAEKAKAEAEAAKAPKETSEPNTPPYLERKRQDLPPMPDPPKIDSIPVGNAAKQAAETVDEEMNRFLSIVESAFAPVRDARSKLKHSQNITRAEDFAEALGAAWKKFKSPTQ